MQGTRYVARINFLERTGMCIARREMRLALGKPRFVECAICGVMLDLGTIDMGYEALYRHLIMRHVPRNVTLFESESEDTENETDSDDLTESEDDGKVADEERKDDDSFDDEEKDFSEEEV